MEFLRRDIHVIGYYLFKKGYKANQAANEINKTLGDNFTSERSTQEWFKRWRDGENWLDEKPTGRPKKLDDDDLFKLIREDPNISTSELASKLNVSTSSVRKRLKALGFELKQGKWGIF